VKAGIALGLLAAAVVAAPTASLADDTSGHVALELASLVGIHSPTLTAAQKAQLNRYLAGSSSGRGRQIVVKSAAVQCGAGDVDITSYHCELTFGGATRSFTARAAHELLATLGEAGVQGDGAAGTIYFGVTNLSCTLVPTDISENGGGGASCTFTTGQ